MDEGLGKALREARNRRRLGLSDVEDATKIRTRFLRALENEEWDQLPGDAYARAFIRTYASHLGLDGEEMAERQRRLSGTVGPAESVPQVEPVRVAAGARSARRGLVTGLLALVAVGAVAAIALAISAGGGGSSSPGGSPARHAGGDGKVHQGVAVAPAQLPAGVSVRLTARDEVWVCLLDGKGEALVDGVVLSSGSVEGPFQSGSFTVSFGNGEVDMTVDGQQANIPETASPIGFTIGRDGTMRELSEGERPTCT
jgi:cytoskeleton protein RodZ